MRIRPISQELNIKDIMQFIFEQIDGTRCVRRFTCHGPRLSPLHFGLSLSLMIQKLLTAEWASEYSADFLIRFRNVEWQKNPLQWIIIIWSNFSHLQAPCISPINCECKKRTQSHLSTDIYIETHLLILALPISTVWRIYKSKKTHSIHKHKSSAANKIQMKALMAFSNLRFGEEGNEMDLQ